ncbi:MAG TPA: hypothetical protein VMW54_05360 [Terriglobia bacterium]|nr:hypothetical protein [Terriglobia bacterium]
MNEDKRRSDRSLLSIPLVVYGKDEKGEEFEAAESHAVLECRKCQSIKRLSLSSIEVEVLHTSGILVKLCDRCRTTGPWSYPDRQIPLAEAEPSTLESREGDSHDGEAARERRGHGRAPLRLPVRIRDDAGGVEITHSDNLSKGGLSFESDKEYQNGKGLMVTCPIRAPEKILKFEPLSPTPERLKEVRAAFMASDLSSKRS